jgi:predicted dehydrogenase/threonine dehydrogenase-like Zn-dependent dehydrogenase
MRQVLQELDSGKTRLADVPEPATPPGWLRILTRRSLISPGTERMLVEFARAGWLERARQQPERVRQVLEKFRTDGAVATLEAVRARLDQALPLGYCNVGEVDVAVDCPGFAPGDRVVSNGAHAEVVTVPLHLCARVPEGVPDDAAAFTVLGAIALQGVRLAAPTLGESFVVTGLGLIGLLTVQLLQANGCRVLGIDPDASRTALARRFGAATVEPGAGEDPLVAAQAFTGGRGVDAVLITASTRSDEPVSQAARMCRKRGRIVLVGVAGLTLNRGDFYEKELTFQVSCSYGPGRYDPEYEEGGRDYPLGFVRWTEQRNLEAVLELMAGRRLDVLPLITHRFAFEDAPRAYELLAEPREASLGVLLEYPERPRGAAPARRVSLAEASPAVAGTRTATAPAVALIGAGQHAARTLIPALIEAGASLVGIASRGGVTAAHLGRRHGFGEVTTDAGALIADPRVKAVVIATHHDTHAAFVEQALAAGKHVFVEKPLAITAGEIDAIESALASCAGAQPPILMVGFNRRFAPQLLRVKSLLQGLPGPRSIIATVNAGALPAGHWTRSAAGGGRLIGEACHFVDLLRFLTGANIVGWDLALVRGAAADEEPATITLAFADGSTGTIHYFTNGHASYPKERIEVFASGRILQLDNFRTLRAFGWSGLRASRSWRQDKGQRACVAAFVAALREGRESPIPSGEILEVSRVTVAIAEAARRGA